MPLLAVERRDSPKGQAPEGPRFHLVGRVDGGARQTLALGIPAKGGDAVVLDCEGIQSVNSAGARAWAEAMKDLAAGRSVELHRCSVSLIDSVNLFPTMVRHAVVESFFCPYKCPTCAQSHEVLYETSAVRLDAPAEAPACKDCGETMALTVPWSEYCSFVDT